jgi:(p)ppGpp synthase/HD superfamily hydrolase
VTVPSASVNLVASLAKRWMPGTRHGSDRPSWMHPQDVVEVVRQVPGIRDTLSTQPTLEAVAWGHDLLEDGVTESGAKVTEDVLRAEGVPDEVVVCIKLLSKEPWMTTPWYARQVMGAPDVVRIVKCADRIANLTEARGTFDDHRWAKYVAETREWILPMAHELGGLHGRWLATRLTELVDAGQG